MPNNINIIVLCAGKSSRMGLNIPKVTLTINGVSLIENTLKNLQKLNPEKIILVVGFKKNLVIEEVKKLKYKNIEFIEQKKLLGTGDAVKPAISKLNKKSQVIVLNGDTYFDVQAESLLERKSVIDIGLYYTQDLSRYGVVNVEDNDFVSSFIEKGAPQNLKEGCINSGVYRCGKEIAEFIGEGFVSLETETFSQLVYKKLITGRALGGKFIDIGIPKDYKSAYNSIHSWSNSPREPVLFLDRDGVVIEDTGYPHKKSDLKIKDKIIPIIKWSNSKNIKVIVITNQAGISKGKFTIKQMNEFHKLLLNELANKSAYIHSIYHCPYHANGSVKEYSFESLLRKPNPGMILNAMKDQKINLYKSLMVGDKSSDIIKIKGLKTLLLKGKYPLNTDNLVVHNMDQLFEEIKNNFG